MIHMNSNTPASQKPSKEENVLTSFLVNAGAHLLACKPDKRPLALGWQKKEAALKLKSAIAWDGLLGLVPASVGLVVVDVDIHDAPVDTGRAAAVAALGEPLSECSSPSGGAHLFYKSPTANVSNSKWRYGDVRGSKGYVVLLATRGGGGGGKGARGAVAPDLRRLPKSEKKSSRIRQR